MYTPEGATWGLPVERERKRRIDVTVWAYAYELEDVSLVPDAVYDSEALKIVPQMPTGRALLDAFFATHFHPSTGQWVHRHPDLAGVRRVYEIKARAKGLYDAAGI